MARRNRNSKYGRQHNVEFPYEDLPFDTAPEGLARAGYAWKWWGADDPERPKMRYFRVTDPDLDANGEKEIVSCGVLVQIRYRIPVTGDIERNPEREFNLPASVSRWSYLMYDRNDPGQRLYTVLTQRARDYVYSTLYSENPFRPGKLADFAKHTHGRHANGWYPDVTVKPVGLASVVIYDADKKTDGRSNYIHRFGEETGIRPMLCVDAKGGLWFAGGDYTTPTAGITN